MAFDAHKNLAISAVVTAPTPATSGTSLSVTAGEGARFPVAPFNATVWPANAMPTPATGEVIRVTARATDVLTITRAQEGSTARPIGTGDLIAATITAKTLTDLETQAALKDAANVFTQQQTISDGAAARLTLTHSGAAPDMRKIALINVNQDLYVQTLGDIETALATPITLTRGGDAKAGRDLYEKGRVVPLGASQTWTPAGATAEAAAIGGSVTARFSLVGATVFWDLACTGFSIPASTAFIYFALPAGYGGTGASLARLYVPGLAYQWGFADINGSAIVFTYPGGAWPAGVGHVFGQGFYFTTGL